MISIIYIINMKNNRFESWELCLDSKSIAGDPRESEALWFLGDAVDGRVWRHTPKPHDEE